MNKTEVDWKGEEVVIEEWKTAEFESGNESACVKGDNEKD